jgi:hypothetical protein
MKIVMVRAPLNIYRRAMRKKDCRSEINSRKDTWVGFYSTGRASQPQPLDDLQKKEKPMSTIVEKILNELAEGKIEVDDGEISHLFYPVGLPLYIDVVEPAVVGFDTR